MGGFFLHTDQYFPPERRTTTEDGNLLTHIEYNLLVMRVVLAPAETYHQNKQLNAQSHRVSGSGTAAGKPVTCHHDGVGIRDTRGTLTSQYTFT